MFTTNNRDTGRRFACPFELFRFKVDFFDEAKGGRYKQIKLSFQEEDILMGNVTIIMSYSMVRKMAIRIAGHRSLFDLSQKEKTAA
jgi:hypothetical protein